AYGPAASMRSPFTRTAQPACIVSPSNTRAGWSTTEVCAIAAAPAIRERHGIRKRRNGIRHDYSKARKQETFIMEFRDRFECTNSLVPVHNITQKSASSCNTVFIGSSMSKYSPSAGLSDSWPTLAARIGLLLLFAGAAGAQTLSIVSGN